jgi:hypothetical protein
MAFILNGSTKIESDIRRTPVINGIRILERDLKKVFGDRGNVENRIVLKECGEIEAEGFLIEVVGGAGGANCGGEAAAGTSDGISDEIFIRAKDDLGFIYGLLFISERFLKIRPFWFWLDQKICKSDGIEVKEGEYTGNKPVIKYRGWFFNDEVLLDQWKIKSSDDPEEPWKMALEALLRCGGNLAIPGTDKNSVKYRKLAVDMGLWITHHHAEPLGAEMFARAYPGVQANYSDKSELFHHLWETAVKEQKDYKVIWNLGFRGQGDCPFWTTDNTGKYDTEEKRGKLISDIIELQRQLVKQYVIQPVFCTNLYGEVMELYKEGHVTLADEIIKVGADNGFGKMVTRRRDNHCTRVSSLPGGKEEGHGGIYYHVSFYDLQAANHITMLPNSVEFVNRQLNEVIDKNVVDFWVINCSNVRPHTYYLDAVRKKWFGLQVDDHSNSLEFAQEYYGGNKEIARCYENYPEAMISYGEQEDEHAGEQFYTENIRIIAHHFIKDRQQNARELFWLTGDAPIEEQVKLYCSLCEKGIGQLESYVEECRNVCSNLALDGNIGNREEQLFRSTLLMQAEIHAFCAKGVVLFGKGYQEYVSGNYKKAFVLLGASAEYFDDADQTMRASEYGVWENFYFNDCLADVKHTAYMIRKMMGVIRELGDNTSHDRWYRDTVYPVEDREVFLLLVLDNHMTDWELYEAMKAKMDMTELLK